VGPPLLTDRRGPFASLRSGWRTGGISPD